MRNEQTKKSEKAAYRHQTEVLSLALSLISKILWVLVTKLLSLFLFWYVSFKQLASRLERADLCNHTPVLGLFFSLHGSHLYSLACAGTMMAKTRWLLFSCIFGEEPESKVPEILWELYPFMFAAGGASFFAAGLPWRRPEDFACTCSPRYGEEVSSRTIC